VKRRKCTAWRRLTLSLTGGVISWGRIRAFPGVGITKLGLRLVMHVVLGFRFALVLPGRRIHCAGVRANHRRSRPDRIGAGTSSCWWRRRDHCRCCRVFSAACVSAHKGRQVDCRLRCSLSRENENAYFADGIRTTCSRIYRRWGPEVISRTSVCRIEGKHPTFVKSGKH